MRSNILRQHKRNWERKLKVLSLAIWAIVLVVVICCFASCRTLPPITTNHSHEKDSTRIEYRYDSIYIDRWHTQYQKGDTVFIHDSIYQNRVKHDSIFIDKYINTTDTIYQPVEIEKQGSAFWKGSGIAFWVLLAILFIGGAVGLAIKISKR